MFNRLFGGSRRSIMLFGILVVIPLLTTTFMVKGRNYDGCQKEGASCSKENYPPTMKGTCVWKIFGRPSNRGLVCDFTKK